LRYSAGPVQSVFFSNHRRGPHQMLTACGCRLSGRIKLTHYQN
jgi:hypothetical protein